MALFIRDPAVDALAEEVRRLTRARSKTEAVRNALLAQLAQARRTLPVRDRLARAQALADAMGPSDPTFDMKAWTDAMWDER
ncbi:type II toxin-antitoxin system VapB family antitoxin [Rhodoplanes sp. SY1]|uniref:type II toxin-antitoxin system VapB family antitoxin n=1 Tax=Rhodoplanes sp. SY1 TaxID=3166646 RepID=UPI0038B5DC4E